MREVVEEAQLAQHRESLLVVDLGLRDAQLLVHARQLRGEFRARAIAIRGLLLQRPVHDCLEFSRYLRAHLAQRLGHGLHDLPQQLAERAGPERPLPAQHLVHDGAERIEVGARVELEALHLLGRHVGGASGDALEPRDVRVRDERDAEVDDAHVAVLRQQDVGRLDVAVHDAARVRVVQRLGALVDDRRRPGRSAAGCRSGSTRSACARRARAR